MNKNELLHKLTEYEIGLMKAKVGLLRAGMTDTSGYDGQIAAIEYVRTLAMMLDMPEEKPVKIPEDYWRTVSIVQLCRILADKCEKKINEIGQNDIVYYYALENLRDDCRGFTSDFGTVIYAPKEK